MKGKICLVTGSSSGIGKATALGLAKMDATVVMVCRNKKKAEEVCSEIKEKSRSDSVDFLLADLSSQSSIRELVKSYLSEYEMLDVLINNAGVYFTKRHVTVDGIETTFAVNYLAPFLLTNLLLNTLKSSAPARIINVAGAYHAKGTINFDDLQGEKKYSGSKANNQSKLALVLFTYELARRLKGTGVTVNCLHPGAVATSLIEKDRDYPSSSKFIYKLFKLFLKSPEKGAETTLYLASSLDVKEVTGKYFVNRRITQSSKESYNTSIAKRLWDVSMELTNMERS